MHVRRQVPCMSGVEARAPAMAFLGPFPPRASRRLIALVVGRRRPRRLSSSTSGLFKLEDIQSCYSEHEQMINRPYA